MSRRAAFWIILLSPLLTLGAAFHVAVVLEVLGAECVTSGPSYAFQLDYPRVCNSLGELREDLGWAALGLAFVLVPVGVITGGLGAWRAVRRGAR
jgi:hypothetical protein